MNERNVLDEQTPTSPAVADSDDSYDQDRQRVDELLRWWALSVYNTGDENRAAPYEPIADYAIRKLGKIGLDITSIDKVLDPLEEQIRSCEAKCPMQFREWCYNRIDKLVNKLRPKKAAEKRRRKDTKPFRFHYKQSGQVALIPLQDSEGRRHIWKIPIRELNVAELLWPVYIRKYPNGKPYVARKVPIRQFDGKSTQVARPAHRHYLVFKYPALEQQDIDSTRARARNGDFLDWTGDNIYLPVTDPKRNPISERQQEFVIKKNLYEAKRRFLHGEWVPVDINPKLLETWERRLAEEMMIRTDFLEVDENKPKRFRKRSYVPEERMPAPGVDSHGIPIFGGLPPARPGRPEGEGPDTDWDGDNGEELMHPWFGSGFDAEYPQPDDSRAEPESERSIQDSQFPQWETPESEGDDDAGYCESIAQDEREYLDDLADEYEASVTGIDSARQVETESPSDAIQCQSAA